MKIGIVAVTKKSLEKAFIIKNNLKSDVDIYTVEKFMREETLLIENSLKELFSKIFNIYDAFIFITATGIAVRTVAPFIKSKDKDPGVVVIDENSNFVISLLSGHLGGANDLTKNIGEILNSIPVITTASDSSGKIAVDTIAMKLKSKLESLESAKKVTSLIVAGENVELKVPENISNENPSGVIVITNREKIEVTKIIPKNLVVGIGCKKNTGGDKIISSIKDSFLKYNLSLEGIKCLATIDIKKDEIGIKDTAKFFNVDLKIIEKKEIEKIQEKFESSNFVLNSVGVKSVSAPSAVIASGKKGKLLAEKLKYEGITISIYEEETRCDG